MSMTTDTGRHRTAAWHQALFYENGHQYVAGVGRFVTAALDAGRPVFVSVPAANGALLRQHLNGQAERVRFADMTQVGRNPSCIIPIIQAFIDEHADQTVSFVGEPIWADRTPAEVAEATRHEALINAAFEGTGAQVLCPYDITGLQSRIIADAFRTHPELVSHDGQRQTSERYADPHTVWSTTAQLSPVPPGAQRLTVTREGCGELRRAARGVAEAAVLPEQRIGELLVAVTELATNSVLHGGGTATVAIWAEADSVVCEVRDTGTIDDPLVGRRQPRPDLPGGRGLWIVNQLCNLVQLESSSGQTRTRATLCPT